MTISLTSEERAKLIDQHKAERDKRRCDRIKAVLAYDDGHSYSEIARWLLLDDETIRRHIADYQAEQKLHTANGGSQSKLSDEQSQSLIAHLTEKTYLVVKDIVDYVKKGYGIIYSISGMTCWLKHNGFVYKQPKLVPAKADKMAQQAFVEQYEKLKLTAKGPIYFADSVHPQHQTQAVCGWIRKGQDKLIASTARQKRVNLIGAINLADHRLIYQQVDWVNVDSIEAFLIYLRKQHPGKQWIELIWDNAGYHRSKTIKRFAKANKIRLHYLPAYSPNLNPIERMWKLLREQVTYNRYYERFTDFIEAILHFCKTISKKKKLLRARITDNFHLLHSPLLTS